MVDSRILDKYNVHFCAVMSNRFDVQKLKLAVHMISARSIIILYIYKMY